MINWYPNRVYSATIDNFSPRLKEVLANPKMWGLDSGKGQYRYFTERYEINRFDSYTQTPYTQWTNDQSETWWVLETWDPIQGKLESIDLSRYEVEIEPSGDIVADTLVSWLKELSTDDGYKLLNISPADLNIVEEHFEESGSTSGGTGEFEPTGNVEFYGMEWTAKVDFSNWRQVKL
jgi:hypothetical protein